MAPKQQPPSSPTSLLWAHQLKREHGFLLDRMQKLEAAIDRVEKSTSAAANRSNTDVENLSRQVQALAENTNNDQAIQKVQKEVMNSMEEIHAQIEAVTEKVAQVDRDAEYAAADRKTYSEKQAALEERVKETELALKSYRDKMTLLGRSTDIIRGDEIMKQLESLREQAQDRSGKDFRFEESMAMLEEGIQNLQRSNESLTAEVEFVRRQYAKPSLPNGPVTPKRIAQAKRLAEAFPEDPTPPALLDQAAKVARTKAIYEQLGVTDSQAYKTIVTQAAALQAAAPETTATETTAPKTTAPGTTAPEAIETMPKPATDRAAAARAARAAKRKNSDQSKRVKNAKTARAARAEQSANDEYSKMAPPPATEKAAAARPTRAAKQKNTSQPMETANLHTVRSSRVRKNGVEKESVSKPPVVIDPKLKKPVLRAGRGWVEVERTPSPEPEAAPEEPVKRGRGRPKQEDQSTQDVAFDLADGTDEQPTVPPAPPRKDKATTLYSIQKKEKLAALPKRRAIVQDDDTQNIVVFGKGRKRKAGEQPDEGIDDDARQTRRRLEESEPEPFKPMKKKGGRRGLTGIFSSPISSPPPTSDDVKEESQPAPKRRTIPQNNHELFQQMYGKKK